jgi:hypothetical protein
MYDRQSSGNSMTATNPLRMNSEKQSRSFKTQQPLSPLHLRSSPSGTTHPPTVTISLSTTVLRASNVSPHSTPPLSTPVAVSPHDHWQTRLNLG